jgi:hypothetical protein
LRSTYTGNGSTTTYALPGPVANETSIIATINGVTQQDAAYSTDGSNIIFVAAPALGDSIEIRTLSAIAMSYAPMDGSVVTGKIADLAVTTAKINDASVTGAKLGTGAAVANIGARAITAGQMPAGTVLQVVQATTYSPQTMSITTSGTLVASGFTLSITPTSATSKILYYYSSTVGSTSSNSGVAGNVQMYRSIGGGAYGYSGGTYQNYWNTTATYIAYQQLSFSMMILDSPATTSAITYQPYFNFSCGTSGGLGVLGGRNTDGLSYSGSYIIAMEIAA